MNTDKLKDAMRQGFDKLNRSSDSGGSEYDPDKDFDNLLAGESVVTHNMGFTKSKLLQTIYNCSRVVEAIASAKFFKITERLDAQNLEIQRLQAEIQSLRDELL